MSHPVKGVDHSLVMVKDLQKSAAQYRALGFTLSPRGLHSEAKGSANYTIMFPDDYLELLGLLRATPLNATRGNALAKHGEGLHGVACRIDTADCAAKDLAELGIGAHGLNSFERPVNLPDGGTGVAAFSTLIFDNAEVPMGAVFMCQHRTRETVWLPELLTHANTACGMEAILVASETPEEDSKAYAQLWADGQVVAGPQGFIVETGPNSASLILMTSKEMGAHYPDMDLSQLPTGVFSGLRVKVADLNAVEKCLKFAKIKALKTERGLAVSPNDTSGVILEFVLPEQIKE